MYFYFLNNRDGLNRKTFSNQISLLYLIFSLIRLLINFNRICRSIQQGISKTVLTKPHLRTPPMSSPVPPRRLQPRDLYTVKLGPGKFGMFCGEVVVSGRVHNLLVMLSCQLLVAFYCKH